MKKNELSVVFLMWVPYGIDYLISFVNSYLEFDSNVNHELIILYNGYNQKKALIPYQEFLKSKKIEHNELFLESGQDISAYHWVAERLDSEYLLFFNTYSQILNNGWGKNYLNAIKNDAVGCVGATGSWQSWSSFGYNRAKFFFRSESVIKKNLLYYNSKQFNIGPLRIQIPPRLALLGSLIKSFTVYRHFPKFPNPHIRTNAFIIRKKDWLNLKFPNLKNKREAHLFESGNESLTRQIIKSGKKVFVMNKHGVLFEPHEWNNSRTFWSSFQEDLLISDNVTSQYAINPMSGTVAFQNSFWEDKSA